MTARPNVILAALGLCSLPSLGQDAPPLEFAVISDVGNRDTTFDETRQPGWGGTNVGSVDYEYAIAVREVTVGEYFEFVLAYLPYYEARTGNSLGFFPFVGTSIQSSNGSAWILPGVSPDDPADMAWEYAARYVNWLHNGKVIEAWAFDTGAYDTSTFVSNDAGEYQHQETRSPHARYWIPSADEWVKAAYWDPNGDGRYWRYPTSSNVEPIPGLLPQDGGERNAGLTTPELRWPLPVMSFNMTSPWGLYDTAGGVTEHSETICPPGYPELRGAYGSDHGDRHYGNPNSDDLLGASRNSDVRIGRVKFGLRLARTALAPADLNLDGFVNFFDLSRFVALFLAGSVEADLNDDLELNVFDIEIFIGLYALNSDRFTNSTK